ncbi:hypothetical protein HJG60_007814 [Phyllostomus discolor]|uniref:BAAT/Acyl-CoA thioester hydrolase C-terminal domain-containing protein n=1 Tax=Phyllostomus discolor TaxID=89673 RepID=A0A834EV49_9CHIR|nr:hypothetical protein HJG60_007814 [Phyllostomus discolor]
MVEGGAQMQAELQLPSSSRLYRRLVHRLILFPLSLCRVKGPGAGLLGISKGGDLCLSMALFLKGITAAVIINGSAVNVVGDLHYRGETLPAMGVHLYRIKVTKDSLADILDILNNPLEESDQKCLIPVERAESAFLFLLGQDDRNWRSEFYANEASKHLQAHVTLFSGGNGILGILPKLILGFTTNRLLNNVHFHK